jgi:hypothetical protein
MAATSSNLNDRATNGDIPYRTGGLVISNRVGVPIAKLTGAPSPPTTNVARVQQGTGLVATSSNLNDRATNGDIPYRTGGLVISNIIGVGIAKLTKSAISPATNAADVEQGAGVAAASSNLHDSATHRYIPGRLRELIITNRVRVSIAKSTRAAISPATNVAGVEQGAGVAAASGNLHDSTPDSYVPSGLRELIVTNRVRVSIAKLTQAAISPATNVAGIQQGARLKSTSSNLNDSATDGHIPSRTGGLVVTNRIGVCITKLARGTIPPATNVAGVEQGAGVAAASGNLHHSATHRYIPGRLRELIIPNRVGVPIAKSARAAIPPATNVTGVEQGARMETTSRDPLRQAFTVHTAQRTT